MPNLPPLLPVPSFFLRAPDVDRHASHSSKCGAVSVINSGLDWRTLVTCHPVCLDSDLESFQTSINMPEQCEYTHITPREVLTFSAKDKDAARRVSESASVAGANNRPEER